MANRAEPAIPSTRADNNGPHTSVTPPSLPRPRLPVRKPDLEPASAKAAPCRATLTPLQHRVARSDTLQGLAVRYGVTPNAILTYNKLPNAQALFARGGYEEPADAMAALTQMQIAQRGTKGGPLASLGLVEVGHILLKKELRASDYN